MSCIIPLRKSKLALYHWRINFNIIWKNLLLRQFWRWVLTVLKNDLYFFKLLNFYLKQWILCKSSEKIGMIEQNWMHSGKHQVPSVRGSKTNDGMHKAFPESIHFIYHFQLDRLSTKCVEVHIYITQSFLHQSVPRYHRSAYYNNLSKKIAVYYIVLSR